MGYVVVGGGGGWSMDFPEGKLVEGGDDSLSWLEEPILVINYRR